eukprot:CAMPEP_0175082778 /NCGR_PEP_ID=MMETSP0052_2-20121109/26955_1 /TAXON_ID=51329 ORGANISM="Polytomella parva, Strain SAG 63-3" /NCGR_SAMPLE_ID=MMETSP0052_2 /ASSEMBLY_ACC=CAM_ASM_000194 /LENGTH=39 /DNA_ID= /DNA_START= /DNA_END= /DNA_ORIENTATION=
MEEGAVEVDEGVGGVDEGVEGGAVIDPEDEGRREGGDPR